MTIREISVLGLRGGTPAGGWSDELQPDDCVHTLVIVKTDEQVIGWGSVATNDGLVRSSLALLEPLYLGESALEPERVAEKLRQHMFWYDRDGAITHTISGIDIALWDIVGKVTNQSVGRLLGGKYRTRVKAYASLLMEEPARLAERLSSLFPLNKFRKLHPHFVSGNVFSGCTKIILQPVFTGKLDLDLPRLVIGKILL